MERISTTEFLPYTYDVCFDDKRNKPYVVYLRCKIVEDGMTKPHKWMVGNFNSNDEASEYINDRVKEWNHDIDLAGEFSKCIGTVFLNRVEWILENRVI